jgi:hypothetical protein
MFGTMAILLMILWVLGLVSSLSMGGLVHVLLVLALLLFLAQAIQGYGREEKLP